MLGFQYPTPHGVNLDILNIKIAWPKDINLDAKNLIIKILKADPNARLTPQEMLHHPFFTKYYKDPTPFLIKPSENVQYKPFVVSQDNPKTWNPETEKKSGEEPKIRESHIKKLI